MTSFYVHRESGSRFILENEFSGEKVEVIDDVCQRCNSHRCHHTKAIVVAEQYYARQFPIPRQ